MPVDLGSYSSRVTLMGGNAVKTAAEDVNARLYNIAARELGCEPTELTSGGRRIYNRHALHIGMDFAEAARRFFSLHGPLVGTGCYEPPRTSAATPRGPRSATRRRSPSVPRCARWR